MSIQTITEARPSRRSKEADFDPAAWLARVEAQGYEVYIGHDEQGGQNLATRETKHPGFLLRPERRPELADTAGNERGILRHLRTIGRVGMAHYKVQNDMPNMRGMTETDHLRAGDSLVVGSIPGLTRRACTSCATAISASRCSARSPPLTPRRASRVGSSGRDGCWSGPRSSGTSFASSACIARSASSPRARREGSGPGASARPHLGRDWRCGPDRAREHEHGDRARLPSS